MRIAPKTRGQDYPGNPRKHYLFMTQSFKNPLFKKRTPGLDKFLMKSFIASFLSSLW
jgi:hypothetical protein